MVFPEDAHAVDYQDQREFPKAWFADAYGLTETVSGDLFLANDKRIARIGRSRLLPGVISLGRRIREGKQPIEREREDREGVWKGGDGKKRKKRTREKEVIWKFLFGGTQFSKFSKGG